LERCLTKINQELIKKKWSKFGPFLVKRSSKISSACTQVPQQEGGLWPFLPVLKGALALVAWLVLLWEEMSVHSIPASSHHVEANGKHALYNHIIKIRPIIGQWSDMGKGRVV